MKKRLIASALCAAMLSAGAHAKIAPCASKTGALKDDAITVARAVSPQ